MFIDEEILQYALYFLNRADIETQKHKEAVKQLRTISNELLETLYKPKTINVIRKPRPKD